MSIYRDQLYYDNSNNTLVCDANLSCSGVLENKKYFISSTVSATQSIPSGTATAIAFTADTRTNWPTRADNTQFVAPVAGTYLVSVQAGYATAPGTAGVNKLLVFKNTDLIGTQQFSYETEIGIFNWSGVVTMDGDDDYIEVKLEQSSGGAVNAGGTLGDGGNINKVTIDRLHS